jgi:hypothetical protein
MKHVYTIFKTSVVVFALLFAPLKAKAQLTENFDNITTLTAAGWSMQNLSTTIGTQANWFQGNSTVYAAFNGAATSYIGANYNFTTGANTISGWLMTPQMTIRNGDVFTFYSRKVSPDSYPDRLEVRLSTNGASTNAGATSTSVGDFTTLLMTINPTLVTGVYPVVWTQYTVTISGLGAPASGRVAFRYFVTGGGPSGSNSDYIGIDAFNYVPYVCPAMTVTPTTLPNGTAGSAYSQSLGQTGGLGTVAYTVTAGSLPSGLTLSSAGVVSGTPTATGPFNFTVTVTDASGCMGSQAYSITIQCPTNGATMSAVSALCSNGSPYTLIEGSPSGGTYSGTGVTAGAFDPSAGTQTVVYTVVDGFGCTQTASTTITVNTAPTVTLSSFSAVCDNGGMVTLTGESPSGGMFMGTNVSGGMFDPSGGTQMIMYMYTDGNGCSGSASQSFPVNAAPTVTASASASPICLGDSVMVMGGGAVTYTWDNSVTDATNFAPAGSNTYNVTGTDANGCTNTASVNIIVNALPDVFANASATTVCPGGNVILSGSGAISYTWDNSVMDSVSFAPASTMLYTVVGTDANGCMDSDTITVNVNTVLPVVANATATSLCLGEDVILSGSGAVTYAWDNSVIDGMSFTPVATATYIVTGTDANGCNGSDTITITVNTPPVVAATSSASTACTTDGAITLVGTPAGGTFSGPGVTGTSFNPATAGSGTHTITYDFTDANGCTGSATLTITVNVCAGVMENNLAGGVSVYPNPNDGSFFAEVSAPAVMVVYNALGEVVLSQNIEAGKTPVDLGANAKGIYTITFITEAGVKTVRVSVE